MNEKKFYTGSWEKNGRSVTAAATISLIGIGVFYFYFQSFATAIVVSIVQLIEKTYDTSPNRTNELSNSSIAALRIVIFSSQYLCMFFPSWLIIRRFHTQSYTNYVRLKKYSFREVALAVIGAIALFPISVLFSTFLTESLHIPEKLLKGNETLFTSYTPIEFIWLVFSIAITPAICEELFFRGHVQRTMERTLSFHSIWIVGIIFGLFHFQPIGLASLSLLGLYFGYLYYRSKSIYPSMAAHFVNNTLALLFSYKPFVESQEWITSVNSSEISVAALGSIPLAAGTLMLFYKQTRSGNKNQKMENIIPETSEEFIQMKLSFSFMSEKEMLRLNRNRKDTISIRQRKRIRMLRNR